MGYLGNPICWTRMQAEAGQQLARIVRRKELERRAGDGLFFWGVGNAPSRAVPVLARSQASIDLVFSIMKSKPKAHDAQPAKVLAWTSYVDGRGAKRVIPDHILVTSRAGSRDYHYALVCHSDEPLTLADRGPFDPAAYRNFGAGAPVGASQVTALLEPCADEGPSDYRVAMKAHLVDGFWVKLTDPVEVTTGLRQAIDEADATDVSAWLELATAVRSPPRNSVFISKPAQEFLFTL